MSDIRPAKRRTPHIKPHRRTLIKNSRRPARTSRQIIKYGISFFALILIVATYIVLFRSSLFMITEPIIVGNVRVDQNMVQEKIDPLLAGSRWGLFPKRVLFVVSPTEIKELVKNSASAILSVDVRKELPNILKVEITEREPLAIWSAAGQFFFIDKEGIAYDKILRSESKDANISLITDEHNKPTVEGDRVITNDTLKFVRTISDSFSTVGDLGVNFFIAPSRLAPDLTLVTSEGWKVVFDTSSDADLQISTLREVLKSKVSNTNQLNYVDLRIPGRVFIK